MVGKRAERSYLKGSGGRYYKHPVLHVLVEPFLSSLGWIVARQFGCCF